MGTFPFPGHPGTRPVLVLCTLLPLLFAACGGGNAAQRKTTMQGLDGKIGIATPDDLISDMGPPQQATETPEGTWYTWRKVNSGTVSGGVSIGFLGVSMGRPVETGQELNCLFDRKTGRLVTYSIREW